MWIPIIQIKTFKFVLIYNQQTHQKNLKFQKKGSPLEPRYAGMCAFSTKKLRHWQIWDSGSFNLDFVPGHHPRFETYTNPFPCHIVNPFSMLISVESKFATSHMVIDYESMYTYPLTEDKLRQMCGVNTTFQQISCEHGILPSTICKAFEANQNIQDWGIADLYKPGSSRRDYFYWRWQGEIIF